MDANSSASNSAPLAERRTAPRQPVMRAACFDSPSHPVRTGTALNISRGGICIASAKPFPPGTDVAVELPAERDAPEHLILARGRVVHVNKADGGYRMGVRFCARRWKPSENIKAGAAAPGAAMADASRRAEVRVSAALRQPAKHRKAWRRLAAFAAALLLVLLLASDDPGTGTGNATTRTGAPGTDVLPAAMTFAATTSSANPLPDRDYSKFDGASHGKHRPLDSASERGVLGPRADGASYRSPSRPVSHPAGTTAPALNDGLSFPDAALSPRSAAGEKASSGEASSTNDGSGFPEANEPAAPAVVVAAWLEAVQPAAAASFRPPRPPGASASPRMQELRIPWTSTDAAAVPASPPEALLELPYILIDVRDRTLTLMREDYLVETFPVGVGKNGSTPLGTFVIANKLRDPAWYNGGDAVAPGDPRNPLGRFWLGLGRGGRPTTYGIHEAGDPDSVGGDESRGCIRMRGPDLERLYRLCPVGARVRIVSRG